MNEKELIRRAMSALGKRTSAAKKRAARRNAKLPRKKLVHKTCPTWGETQCHLTLFPLSGYSRETSYRWSDVTCPKCLVEKPRKAKSVRKRTGVR